MKKIDHANEDRIAGVTSRETAIRALHLCREALRRVEAERDEAMETNRFRAFVADISRMTTDEELDGDMSGDDAVDTVCSLVGRARELLKGARR